MSQVLGELEDVKTDVMCHSRCGTPKSPHCSVAMIDVCTKLNSSPSTETILSPFE